MHHKFVRSPSCVTSSPHQLNGKACRWPCRFLQRWQVTTAKSFTNEVSEREKTYNFMVSKFMVCVLTCWRGRDLRLVGREERREIFFVGEGLRRNEVTCQRCKNTLPARFTVQLMREEVTQDGERLRTVGTVFFFFLKQCLRGHNLFLKCF